MIVRAQQESQLLSQKLSGGVYPGWNTVPSAAMLLRYRIRYRKLIDYKVDYTEVAEEIVQFQDLKKEALVENAVREGLFQVFDTAQKLKKHFLRGKISYQANEIYQ